MRQVAFITIEFGDDLILSFALRRGQSPGEIQSLTLMRTPKYEQFLYEFERGVHVSLEGDDDDVDDYLELFEYNAADKVARIKTVLKHYDLDLRKVDAEELARMGPLLHKMNFDARFNISGI